MKVIYIKRSIEHFRITENINNVGILHKLIIKRGNNEYYSPTFQFYLYTNILSIKIEIVNILFIQ